MEIKTVWDRLYSYGGMQAGCACIWIVRMQEVSWHAPGQGAGSFIRKKRALETLCSAEMAKPVFFCQKECGERFVVCDSDDGRERGGAGGRAPRLWQRMAAHAARNAL